MLKKSIVRGVIPFIIMSLISIIMKSQGVDPFQVKSTFLAGLIISVMAASSTIYGLEKLSLLKQSIIHFILMLLTVFPIFLISGWYDLNSIKDYLKAFGIFLINGLVFWTIGYIVFGKLLKK